MKSFRKAVSVVAIFFIIASCSKDDPTPSVVGKWTVQTSVLDLQVGGQSLYDFLVGVGIATKQAQAVVDSYSDGFNAGSAGAILEFKSDGTYSQQNSVNDTNPSTGTWTQDKTSITMTDSTKPSFTGTIVSVNDTDLSLDLKVKSVDGGGFTVDYVVKTTLKKS
ncbi:MAG: lipocalin family protein [Bacteroidota bacterium]